MESYSQRDQRWANEKIGSSDLTVGRFGCTLTCIADLTTYFKPDLTPRQILEKCKFTPQGLIIWASCNFDNFVFERREYNRNDTQIYQAIADPNRAVILQVANKSHWVVATGWNYWQHLFKIADPWLGDRATMKRYADNITGAAHFRRK